MNVYRVHTFLNDLKGEGLETTEDNLHSGQPSTSKQTKTSN